MVEITGPDVVKVTNLLCLYRKQANDIDALNLREKPSSIVVVFNTNGTRADFMDIEPAELALIMQRRRDAVASKLKEFGIIVDDAEPTQAVDKVPA